MSFEEIVYRRIRRTKCDHKSSPCHYMTGELKRGKPELWFMCSACRLLVLYICVKFHANISDSIRVMERTRMMEGLPDRGTDGWTDRGTLKILVGIT